MTDTPTAPATAPVERITPDPEIWALALREAGGDARCIRVVSWDVVVVCNRPLR